MDRIDKITGEDWIKYLEKNKGEAKQIFGFVFLWMEYNEWYNKQESALRPDKKRALLLKNDPNAKTKYNFESKGIIKGFEVIKPYDENSQKRTRVYNLKNKNEFVVFSENDCSFENYLSVIYTIRCNFFHGDKNIPNETNIKLIKWAYETFESIFAIVRESDN